MCSSEFATDRRQRGATTTALAVLLVVTMATTVGIALSASGRSLFYSTSFMKKTAEMMLAEAAVEDAMNHLDALDDWGDLQLPYEEFTAPITVGSGSAWADIRNDLFDPSTDRDSNGAVLIKGYGKLLNSDTADVESIEVLYWKPSLSIPPIAGLNICGEDIYEPFGNALVSGLNHDLPELPCSGRHCQTDPNEQDPDVIGIAFENAGREAVTGLPARLEGTPEWASGVCMLQGASGLCSRVQALMQYADRLVGFEELLAVPRESELGTPQNPRLLIIPEGRTLRFTGNRSGAGVLLVEGTLIQRGTFTWIGPIIVGAGATLDLRGTTDIYGSVVTAGTEEEPATLIMGGSASIRWAERAVFIGPSDYPAHMNSWRETRLNTDTFVLPDAVVQ